jgi:hypothetical protein
VGATSVLQAQKGVVVAHAVVAVVVRMEGGVGQVEGDGVAATVVVAARPRGDGDNDRTHSVGIYGPSKRQ